MSDIIRKPYEISLWDEVLTFVVQVGENIEEYSQYIPSETKGQVVAQYYKERKLCVIGSDTMEAPCRAIQPKLVSNINGANTLTFNMYYKYYDEELDEITFNPFHKLLTNERKIKLRYGAPDATDTKWYDLIIKNVQENSENNTFVYTCKDQFVNELSKSGFNIQLDTELENNMGTITKLANTILEDSDWKVRDINDTLIQYTEEPLYKIQLKSGTYTAINVLNEDETITIVAEDNAPKYIYAFYSMITDKKSELQFLYSSSNEFKKDDDYVIDREKHPNYLIKNIKYEDEKPDIAEWMVFSSDYRGERVVRQTKTDYDTKIDKYVKVYKDENGNIIHVFTESEYISPVIVQNLITNPVDFESDAGWYSTNSSSKVENVIQNKNNQTLEELLKLSKKPEAIDTNFISYIYFNCTNSEHLLKNSGPKDSVAQISEIAENDTYVFRIGFKDKVLSPIKSIFIGNKDTNNKISKYLVWESGSGFNFNEDLGVYEYMLDADAQGAKAYSELITDLNLGLYIQFEEGKYYIKEASLFKYVLDLNNNMCVPGGEVTSGVKTKYYAYNPDLTYTSLDDLQYTYIGYEDPGYIPLYNENYEKVRSITATESNRFNLIQDLCEAFECWAKFEIEHDQQTGRILLGKDVYIDDKGIYIGTEDEKYRQQKWVSFHEYIGVPNYVGFRYGVNLKSIQRTLDSEGIVSKLIVKNNANEFAQNGFCSIARADENPSGENFILDFTYYINQGMLDWDVVTNDLYISSNGHIGLYKELKENNRMRDLLVEEQAGLFVDMSTFEANVTTQQLALNATQEEMREQEVYLEKLIKITYEEAMGKIQSGSTQSWFNNPDVIGIIAAITRLKALENNYQTTYATAQKILSEAKKRYEDIETELNDILKAKNDILYRFYKKYSRFLQEGSWISEDYIDDNLYYLDAQSTLFTSAKPKVTYNIAVLELSQLEDYENYRFALGDKTYIEDTEFFGWTDATGILTPYHEEIVVTELTINFDQPETNSIKVQNYKTQFEDLFQRMAATTQSVEYHTGEYSRVTSAVTTQGTIDASVLQNSLLNNSFVLANAKDQSVIWDSAGITTTSLTKPNEMVRIVSGGIFLSNDGGVSFNTGITGSGINANYITTGQLNTSAVNIMSGSFPTFTWNSTGLNAYEFEYNADGNPYNFNYNKFVRMDQHGIYGITGQGDFDPSKKDEDEYVGENKIWKNANFALTWKGFMLKNDDSSVRITSEDDIQVIKKDEKGNDIDRIKIGRLGDGTYGIRIKNAKGAPVMETADDGELWLKNKLHIDTDKGKTVAIGKLGNITDDPGKDHGSRVIDANNTFVVYEDGHLKATSGEFTGTINATGGKIGGLTIEEWADKGYEVVITPENGTAVKQGSMVKLTAHLYKGGKEVLLDENSCDWYDATYTTYLETGLTYEFKVEFGDTDYLQYGCVINYNEQKEEGNE